MDLQKIKKLIQLVKESHINELQVNEGDQSIKIVVQHEPQLPTTVTPSTTSSTTALSTSPETTKQLSAKAHTVKAPMVGTVYLSPSPGAKPFTEVGRRIKAGDTICLIEAMKMFNRVEAEVSGVVSACLIENSHPTEYDQPLFIIEKD